MKNEQNSTNKTTILIKVKMLYDIKLFKKRR